MTDLFNIAHMGAAFVAGAIVVGVLQRLALTNRLAGIDIREWRINRTSWAEAAVPVDLRRSAHRMPWRTQLRADWADLVVWLLGTRTPVPQTAPEPDEAPIEAHGFDEHADQAIAVADTLVAEFRRQLDAHGVVQNILGPAVTSAPAKKPAARKRRSNKRKRRAKAGAR